MNARTGPRPGGRSARVQSAVHRAAQELIDQIGRTELTVPLIAARAGVTPSTIYRRWGDLADLLADVALQRMREDSDPPDTGTLRGDLQVWAHQYSEEMTSEVGLSMIRDVLAGSRRGGPSLTGECCVHTTHQIERIVERAIARRQTAPTVQSVMDTIVAPIIYRALFGPRPPSPAQVRALVDDCLRRATAQPQSPPNARGSGPRRQAGP